MFDWLLPENHAIAILKKDHEAVQALFEDFANADNETQKEKLLEAATAALKVHAIIEEELFYPAVRAHVGDKIMNEADEEHHVAKVLIAELDHSGRKDDHSDAKFTVLAENVRHHIKEEESTMLPKARELDLDFEALGRRMLDRQAALTSTGIPRDAEHIMIAKTNGKADSPAAAAVKRRRKAPARAAARRQVKGRAHAHH